MSTETIILRTKRGWFYRVPKTDLEDKTIAIEWIKKISEASGVEVKILNETISKTAETTNKHN